MCVSAVRVSDVNAVSGVSHVNGVSGIAKRKRKVLEVSGVSGSGVNRQRLYLVGGRRRGPAGGRDIHHFSS